MTRRVVTGELNGKSVFVSDGPIPRTHVYKAVLGFETALGWSTPHTPALPCKGDDPTLASATVMPNPLGTTMIVVQFPPDSIFESPGFDPEKAGEEYASALPGLAETFDTDGSGMHQTNSIDYDVIVSGELWLELSGGETKHLKAGDIVIQNGTKHAWRNKSSQPATMVAVLIGGKR